MPLANGCSSILSNWRRLCLQAKEHERRNLGHLGAKGNKLRAARRRSKQEFIAEVTAGMMPPPQYFAKNAKLNKTGYGGIDEVLEKARAAGCRGF